MQNHSFDKAILTAVLDRCLYIFGIAVLTYHFSLVAKLSVSNWAGVFGVSLFLGVLFDWHQNSSNLKPSRCSQDNIFLFGLVCLGLFLGLLLLFVSRPDADDVQLFHPALLQLTLLSQPFLTTSEIHDVKGLPLTSLGLVSFYEYFLALMSSALNLDPLWIYHNGSVIIFSVAFCLIYGNLYRSLGLSRLLSWTCVSGAILFLLFDGNIHRSFGNTSFVRIWQGKVVLWTLLIPLAFTSVLNFFIAPGPRSFVRLIFIAICGLGLSATGLFLIPATIFITSIAVLINSGWCKRKLGLFVIVNTSYFYSIIILVMMIVGLLPTYSLSNLFSSWGSTWYENLRLVIPDLPTLIRALLLLFIVPPLFLTAKYKWLIPTFSAVAIFVFMNPVSGPIFFENLTAGSYWRLIYILPIPAAAGLLVGLVFKIAVKNHRVSLGGTFLVLISVIAVLTAVQPTFFSRDNSKPIYYKQVGEYRFREEDYHSAKFLADTLPHNSYVLAPQRIIHILPLLSPKISLETARGFNTLFVFSSANLEQEGLRRVTAQQAVKHCNLEPEFRSSLKISLERGVNAVVVGACTEEKILLMEEELLMLGEWQRITLSKDYTLFKRLNRPALENR